MNGQPWKHYSLTPRKPEKEEWLSLFLDDGESLDDPDVFGRIIRQLG
jgi:hypothetical protein